MSERRHGHDEHQEHRHERGEDRRHHERGEVDPRRQRSAAHALEDPLVTQVRNQDDQALVAGGRNGEDGDSGRVELNEVDLPAGHAERGAAVGGVEDDQEDHREDEREERAARAAQQNLEPRPHPADQQRDVRAADHVRSPSFVSSR